MKTWKLCCALAALCAFSAHATDFPDADGDAIPDAVDNCLGAKNATQRDSDRDGVGNFCDADFNNDSRVNAADLAALQRAFGKRDARFDLDGNGSVNSLDVARLRQLYLKPPGPTAVKGDAGRVKNPPLSDETEIYLLEKPLADGRDSVLVADFRRALPDGAKGGALTLFGDNGPIPLNDLGFDADQVAGDGLYSGLFRRDFAREEKDIAAFIERARRAKAIEAHAFNGREAAERVAFDPADPFEPEKVFVRAPEFRIVNPLVPVGTVLTATLAKKLKLLLPPTTDAAKTLMVTNLNVVQDPGRTFSPCSPAGNVAPTGNPNGAWALKTLLTNMANPGVTGITAQVFVNDWLKKWLTADNAVKHSDGNVVAFGIPARPNLQTLMNRWQPGWNPANPATLNLDKLPFRLLAIVNRLDLAQASFYGPGSPGELRFVFGLLDKPSSRALTCFAPHEMTAILEYQVPTTSCLGLKNLANEWIALDALVTGSAAYNTALQNLTNDVTLANAFPGKFNGSAIGQIRTNDFVFDQPWELREFTLQASPIHGKLMHETAKQTPDKSRNNTALLRNFINDNEADVLLEKHVVDRLYKRQDFLGAANQYGPGVVPVSHANPPWDAAGLVGTDPVKARHKFSLNTCGGCHLGETGTGFTHVKADGALNTQAALSRFLTGTATTPPNTPIADPVSTVPARHFADLFRRGQLLDQVAAKSCFLLPELPVLQASEARFQLPNDSLFSPRFVH